MKDFLKQIDLFKKKLAPVTKWANSGDPFGHISSAKDDYVYEVWCLTKILSALKTKYNVDFQPSTKIAFPKKPRPLSEGWSYFILTHKATGMKTQVSAGIKVKISMFKNYTIAPDIVFSKVIKSVDPTEKDVKLIMDAKFYSKGLDIDDVRKFVLFVREIGCNKASRFEFDTISDLNFNCLLTNSDVYKNQDDYCTGGGIKQVGNFKPKAKRVVIP